MLNEICKYCKPKRCAAQINVDGHCPEKLKKLLITLKDNFLKYECNVDYLHEKLSITPMNLNFLTVKYFKCTPKKLIENLRLEHALISLKKNNYNIIDVANECGYNNIGTFQKAFKRRFKQNFICYKTKLLKSSKKDVLIKNLINELWH
ncbi:MAG: hypothetical protein A2X61_04625 [Ignavibacteria bacterium GWB2_35_12]|nr:MAG: hypothetical protein A2X63_13420 [Ignavibacteria bacterium GWA2_35_8]OGU41915.1 MAG: hypothetical protein A2X61_04625 [Ignavibacteria bacterium GWB2_35_12]OGU87177.1 MAG: hypothetical protein A2220_07835 [Ignavibacteria bacterium RIFOXYA2_FULL_35_10]OGV24589.1 MAG: hypothetical protein A2475_09215 [Ignavibacteria bacterium RIFOXYC2_FULL_35_21]